jgi:hypothetical protein
LEDWWLFGWMCPFPMGCVTKLGITRDELWNFIRELK